MARFSNTDEWVSLEGYKVTQVGRNGKTIGINGDGDNSFNAAIWLPRSQCQDGESLDYGHTDIVMRKWLADERGLKY